jgi:hypothetical protein
VFVHGSSSRNTDSWSSGVATRCLAERRRCDVDVDGGGDRDETGPRSAAKCDPRFTAVLCLPWSPLHSILGQYSTSLGTSFSGCRSVDGCTRRATPPKVDRLLKQSPDVYGFLPTLHSDGLSRNESAKVGGLSALRCRDDLKISRRTYSGTRIRQTYTIDNTMLQRTKLPYVTSAGTDEYWRRVRGLSYVFDCFDNRQLPQRTGPVTEGRRMCVYL